MKRHGLPWPPREYGDGHELGRRLGIELFGEMHSAHCGKAWWRSWVVALMTPPLFVMLAIGIELDRLGALWDHRLRTTRVSCPDCGAEMEVRHRMRGLEIASHAAPACERWGDHEGGAELFDEVRRRLRR